MYFTNWDQFFEAAEKLYHANPSGVRSPFLNTLFSPILKHHHTFLMFKVPLISLFQPWTLLLPRVLHSFLKIFAMQTRYSMKYSHKQAKFVLKVTDDKVVRILLSWLLC